MTVAIALTLVYAAVVVVAFSLCRIAGRADEAMDRERLEALDRELLAARGVRRRGALLPGVRDRRRTERRGSFVAS
jgi:hypothetical protein